MFHFRSCFRVSYESSVKSSGMGRRRRGKGFLFHASVHEARKERSKSVLRRGGQQRYVFLCFSYTHSLIRVHSIRSFERRKRRKDLRGSRDKKVTFFHSILVWKTWTFWLERLRRLIFSPSSSFSFAEDIIQESENLTDQTNNDDMTLWKKRRP